MIGNKHDGCAVTNYHENASSNFNYFVKYILEK